MAYQSIQTNNLTKVKLSDTTKATFANINNNSTELDNRADKADVKFETIENELATNVVKYTDQSSLNKTAEQKAQARTNIGAQAAITDGSATIASLDSSTSIVTLKAGVTQSGGAISNSSGSNIQLAKVAKTGAYGDLSGTPTIPTVNNGTLTIKVGTTTKGTFTANQSGNTSVELTAADFGLSAALRFIGTTTSNISDGSTTNPITIGGESVTATTGDVVIKNGTGKEFLWNGSAWEELGDESSWVLGSNTVTGSGALEGGGALSSNPVITHKKLYDPNSSEANARAAFKYRQVKIDDYGHVSDYVDAVSQTATEGGTVLTLVTTGEKYNWNGAITALSDKMDKENPTGTGYLALNHNTTVTPGTYSVAVGHYTSAAGNSAFAEGEGTTASGGFSHAEGNDTTASGTNSHAEGLHTTANHNSQHVFGMYNEADASTAGAGVRGNYVEIVGNGTGPDLSYQYTTVTPSNARTLDWSGNEVLAGSLTASSIIKSGGTSTQFLKADGSTDGSTYLTSSTGVTSVNGSHGAITGIATESYVNTAVASLAVSVAKTFTATDTRWGALSDGVYTLTINSATSGDEDVAGKHPFVCYNSDNEQVMVTLGFTATTVYIKSDTKFAGTVYMI